MISQQWNLDFAVSTEPTLPEWKQVFCERCKGLASQLVCLFIFVWAKIFDSVSVLIEIFGSSSTTKWLEAEKRRYLQFSGEENDFAYWSEKFEGYMHTKTLQGQLLGTDTSNYDEKYRNWTELVKCLDKRSIIMLKSNCKRNGPEAWKRLTAHVSGSETPRVMSWLEQLTSLLLKPGKKMTDYFIRAETLSSSLE